MTRMPKEPREGTKEPVYACVHFAMLSPARLRKILRSAECLINAGDMVSGLQFENEEHKKGK